MNHRKREDIIKAAIELISARGFHDAPMAMIAERANVAAGTIYRSFESKDDLIVKTYATVEQRMIASITEDYPERESLHERFRHLCVKVVRYFLASPMEFRFIEQFLNSPYGVSTRNQRLNDDTRILTTLFREGQRQQVIKSLPLPVLTALVFGPLIQMCRDHILGFFALDEEAVNTTVEACWDAIRQR
ncbi:TetR/AcrR family transcriptional regulator [Geomonas azotofigens]|uniref:TetR/AcrR family transcriptional regulator n=1 Tax=Geomonas azotofigens TaxID=2843196 RepID=UPI001C128998|nr:TetR/AcrR family transcriptional regulator [Geomonas azotofigens]MBU5613880.1 TetR family transcriptional regulator [Geomonas azotofigens]